MYDYLHIPAINPQSIVVLASQFHPRKHLEHKGTSHKPEVEVENACNVLATCPRHVCLFLLCNGDGSSMLWVVPIYKGFHQPICGDSTN